MDSLEVQEQSLEVSLEGVGAHGHKKYTFKLDFYLPVDEKVSILPAGDA